MNGYLSDPEAQIIIQQLVEIVTDVYNSKLCIYDFSIENFLTHFEKTTPHIEKAEDLNSDVG